VETTSISSTKIVLEKIKILENMLNNVKEQVKSKLEFDINI